MNFEEMTDQALGWITVTGPKVLLIFVLTALGLLVARVIASRVYAGVRSNKKLDREEAKKRAETLSGLVRYVLNVTVLVVTTITLLDEIGVKIGPLLAAAGVVGVAVGFGAQRLVQDIISGFFILIEDQIRAGDVVEIAGKMGTVEKVSIRMTVLRDWSGNVHFVRNSQIDLVTNMTKEYGYALFDIGVAYRESVDDVSRVIEEVAEEMRRDEKFGKFVIEPIEIMGVEQFADSAVVIRARLKTRPLKRWETKREFNRRLKNRFDELDIEIPYPHMTLYAGQDKQGKAAPLRVTVQR